MYRNNFLIILISILFLTVHVTACGDSNGGGDDLVEDDNSDDDNTDDDDETGTGDDDKTTTDDSAQNASDTSTDPELWPCPVQWELFECLPSPEACTAKENGSVSEDYVCAGDGGVGGVCCDLNVEIVEGPDPCPENGETISCQLSWKCWEADGGMLWEQYYCGGDNTLCCESAVLATAKSDAGTDQDAGASDTAKKPADAGTKK